jgi:hypothetical protein
MRKIPFDIVGGSMVVEALQAQMRKMNVSNNNVCANFLSDFAAQGVAECLTWLDTATNAFK